MTLALQINVISFLSMILVCVAQEFLWELWRDRELYGFLSGLVTVLFVIAVVSGGVALLIVIRSAG